VKPKSINYLKIIPLSRRRNKQQMQ